MLRQGASPSKIMASELTKHGLTYEEIGALLGVTPGTVQRIERRALAKCRRALAKQGVTTEDLQRHPAPGEECNFFV